MKKKIDPKTTLLEHSEAKVNFYKSYLQRYLRILYLTDFIKRINIYDVFCGTGIYKNNKKGSPIVTYDEIKNLISEFPNNTTEINLLINDINDKKINDVKSIINNIEGKFKLYSSNKDVEVLFQDLIKGFKNQNTSTRNLIFIDPYGYKTIKKEVIRELLSNEKTEIILFLPISQMNRFTLKSLNDEHLAYKPLKEFIESFFNEKHIIRNESVSDLEYIKHIGKALRFGNKFYSTSYFIQRDKRNYYALFFISSHLYGFEKILEVKWQLDENNGMGFKLKKEAGLFDEQFKTDDLTKSSENLKEIIIEYLKKVRTNNEIYLFTLENEYQISHTIKIINNGFSLIYILFIIFAK